MKKLIAFLLLLVMTVSVFASCGKSKTAATADSGTATRPATTTDKNVEIAKEVMALPAEARKIKIELSDFGNAEKDSKNDVYLAGPDEDEFDNASTIEQMVYRRNKSANELLGTTVEYVYWADLGWSQQAGRIKTLTQTDTDDAPDLFVNMIYDLNNATMNSCFKDLWSIPGSYFDFNAEGWMTDWMTSMSFTGDRAYILAGDYFVDVLRAFGVLPFNTTLMDANGAKLAPALFGEALADTETMSQRFFDYVEAGSWTWDALGKLSAAVWEDKDNNNQTTFDDVVGILGDSNSGMATSIYLYSCGEPLFETKPLSKEDDKNNGKNWVFYAEDATALGAIFDAVSGVFRGDGAFADNRSDATSYHWPKFASGEALFAGTCVIGALESDTFKQMTDLYSVVPLPKVSADKNYNTIIHNIGDAGAINVNLGPDKTRALSAFLQYCTEKSGEIREEFLEIVTKYKTTVYNQGTDRMLDMIYDSVINGRDKAIEDLMRDVDKNSQWHVIMRNGGLTPSSADLASNYATMRSAKQTYLDEKMAIWYTLPKVEDNAE
ncbi:MAG: hypothetical protein J6X72_02295 [Clostridia bacterium]|nr:hypothetical protein [Clostridia bacterium]